MQTESTSIDRVISTLPQDFPAEFFDLMMGWVKLIKSPYGASYYSGDVGWNYKEDGSYRISDHWNFFVKGKYHCVTSTECPDDTHWTLCKYDSKSGKYHVIKSIKKTKGNYKKSLNYHILKIHSQIERSTDKVNSDPHISKRNKSRAISSIELSGLNKFYSILENLGQNNFFTPEIFNKFAN
jgi:hypothetical protein